jgi:hypothetical protein
MDGAPQVKARVPKIAVAIRSGRRVQVIRAFMMVSRKAVKSFNVAGGSALSVRTRQLRD